MTEKIIETRFPVDKHGNGKCKRCNGVSSMSSFSACPHCCPHKEIVFDEDYHDGLYAVCKRCGWNQFSKEEIVVDYEGTKKNA